MNLQDVRSQINEIDASMNKLFHERLECSKEVAGVKMATADKIYKPQREVEIYENYSGDYKEEYILFMKIIMQISRKYQYGIFADNNIFDDGFLNWYQSVIEREDDIIKADIVTRVTENIEQGISAKDLMLAVAGSDFLVEEFTAIGQEVTMKIACNNEKDKEKKMLALCYLIYSETNVQG